MSSQQTCVGQPQGVVAGAFLCWLLLTAVAASGAGKRALGFVLGNQGMIDKTLLFDIELIAVR